ncbi:hypothetical protein T439DRAFT_299788 [Meredithblackwellia eburnea MCA 4105]
MRKLWLWGPYLSSLLVFLLVFSASATSTLDINDTSPESTAPPSSSLLTPTPSAAEEPPPVFASSSVTDQLPTASAYTQLLETTSEPVVASETTFSEPAQPTTLDPRQSPAPSADSPPPNQTHTSSGDSTTSASTSQDVAPPSSTISEIITPSPIPTASESTSVSDLPSQSESPDLSSSSTQPDPIEPLPTEVPVPPEFLSFNEWKEKYVVAQDSPSRRGKKRDRARQDPGEAGEGGDVNGGLYEGEDTTGGTQIVYEQAGTGEGPLVVQLGPNGEVKRAVIMPAGTGSDQPGSGGRRGIDSGEQGSDGSQMSDPSLSPIQPVPNVGTGGPGDPLLLLKDRSNYAGVDCAAKVHRSSRQTKGSSSILDEKKDRYMLSPCSVDPKFVELELCDEIRIDTVVLANYEFFSSMFKKFSIKVSQNYPGRPDEWHDLGTFRARNMRGIQVFYPKSPGGFYRFMRIDFQSHYGSEFYCPVSLLRVYGLTQLDAYRRDEEQRKLLEAAMESMQYDSEDEDEVDDQGGLELLPKDKFWEESNQGKGNASATAEGIAGGGEAIESQVVQSTEQSATSSLNSVGVISPVSSAEPNVSSTLAESSSPTSSPQPQISTSNLESTSTQTSELPTETSTVAESKYDPDLPISSDPSPTISAQGALDVDSSTTSQSSIPPTSEMPVVSPTSQASESSASSALTSTTSQSIVASGSSSSSASPSAQGSSVSTPLSPSESAPVVHSASAAGTATSPSSSGSPHSSSPTTSIASSTSRPIETVTVTPIPTTRSSTRNETRLSPPPPPPVQQNVQGESIYGTIMKRLSSLEHNQTLSLHYVEAQGLMLRDAFLRMEKRLGEVEASRYKHDQLIRQALLDLEKHRLAVDREKLALAAQVNVLTKELVLERRLGVAQLLGLLALFVFVGMTRGSPTTPFFHLVQSQSLRRRFSTKEPTRVADERRREELRTVETRSEEEVKTESGAETTRKHQRTTSLSFRNPSIKRPSGPKTAPRRHYAATTSTRRQPSRSWTPPPIPSSSFVGADESFLASIASAIASERRRSIKVSPHHTSPLAGPSAELFEVSGFDQLPPPRSVSTSTKPRSLRENGPSTADDADAESSEANDDEVDPFLTSAPEEGGTDNDGYRTFSDEDVAVGIPLLKKLNGSNGRPRSPKEWRGPLAIRPPKASLPKRPSTSPGLPPGALFHNSPAPSEKLPNPPPEKLLVNGKGKAKEVGDLPISPSPTPASLPESVKESGLTLDL